MYARIQFTGFSYRTYRAIDNERDEITERAARYLSRKAFILRPRPALRFCIKGAALPALRSTRYSPHIRHAWHHILVLGASLLALAVRFKSVFQTSCTENLEVDVANLGHRNRILVCIRVYSWASTHACVWDVSPKTAPPLSWVTAAMSIQSINLTSILCMCVYARTIPRASGGVRLKR